MEIPSTPKAKKAADIQALHCLNNDCRGLLAYEVDSNNVLYIDLAWTARREGEIHYFPCPKCHGKNIVEAFDPGTGQPKHRVVAWRS